MKHRALKRLLVKKSEGFTLLEVMIALVILSVGLLGVCALQLVAIKTNAFSSEMTYATMIAQQQAEILKSLPFTNTNLDAATESDPHTPEGGGKGVHAPIGRTWTR